MKSQICVIFQKLEKLSEPGKEIVRNSLGNEEYKELLGLQLIFRNCFVEIEVSPQFEKYFKEDKINS